MRAEISRILRVIRKGMIVVIPLILIGSFVAVFQDAPIQAYQRLIATFANGAFIKVTDYAMLATFGCISFFVAGAMGYSYAKEYKEEIQHPSIAMIVCMTAFLTFSYSWKDGRLATELYGMDGILASAFISLCVMTLFKKLYGIKVFRLEKSVYGVDTALKDSYGYIISCTILIVTCALINTIFENFWSVGTVYGFLVGLPVKLFQLAGNNIFTALLYILLVTALSLVGLRGQSVLRQACVAIFAGGTGASVLSSTVLDGSMYSETFFNSFVFMGGSGATISLAICIILYSRSESIRRLNNISLAASAINVNDMMMFGMPIVENDVLALPFLIVPYVNFAVTTLAMKLGIVPPVVNKVDWIMPPILSGHAATGAWSASVLQLLLIVIGVALYKPYLVKNDVKIRKELKDGVVKLEEELQAYEAIGKESDFLTRQDQVGEMAGIIGRDIEYALSHEEFEINYQPQVDIGGKCIGAEALLRWNHKVVGYIYPPLIIAIAKESGKLSELEEFIFDRSCRDLKYIHDNVLPGSKISVNITGASLYAQNLERVIESAVEKYQVDGSKLWIEITEQDAIAMTPEINARLLRLQNKGHKLLIDDFGMGHTSLMYLQNNTFDVVKLDGSITTDVLRNSRSCQIISSIAYLADSMGFKIIAEYVETQEQRDKLAELKCNAFQGYLYSKPLELKDFEQWISERNAALNQVV